MKNQSISKPLPLANVHIQDDFWSEYIRLVREVVIPYQWEALNDRVEGTEPSHAIQNFKIAAGLAQGEFYGMVFQDSDVAKWLEAVSYLLETKRDPDLEQLADEVIEIIAKAQQADGYLNTYFSLKEPDMKWMNLAECHELYCAGHLIEAAVAYYKATGKMKILDVACRLADCIDAVFGADVGKLHGYDGHQEIELALVKLYHATGKETYLSLSQYFLDERGTDPSFYEMEFERRNRKIHFGGLNMIYDRSYSQAHLPVRMQKTAEGHAVRVAYMCSGMADVAAEKDDQELLEACRSLWNNIVTKRMYITGAIGSMAHGEAFSLDYDLPNDTVYAETCASIGLIFFAQRMLNIEAKSEYADVMEQALYNTVISGMSRDGRQFFYVNPLEVWPDACDSNKNLKHVKSQRQGWFGCACCPPNIARLLASLGHYVYSKKEKTLYAHLYIGSQIEIELDGHLVSLLQQSELPWKGDVRFAITVEGEAKFNLALRIPNWCKAAEVRVNGITIQLSDAAALVDGYVHINRVWRSGDTIELNLPMTVNRMKGHPLLRETIGKVALQRGPIVYCMEEADNGANLHQIVIERKSQEQVQFDTKLLGGLQVLSIGAHKELADGWEDDLLYKVDEDLRTEPITATFIPYFAWANRGRGEMVVWVREN
ncbi:glycoside hydrolase family 127 protein [Paenibacillus sp. LMG 31456]|uniref:Glycoside hydrolase family 127 protein n=1 Tax=Paenibacillus foliorum TaxID=2654974 RepID=A0A972GNA5_9BACL|nr:beta-L-arabinofuranosidase domain-containing protein [Paenibacillus foliorum]NOU93926.1 glycoside hydrolase family 127 protein [Paenibacillus foliorum]